MGFLETNAFGEIFPAGKKKKGKVLARSQGGRINSPSPVATATRNGINRGLWGQRDHSGIPQRSVRLGAVSRCSRHELCRQAGRHRLLPGQEQRGQLGGRQREEGLLRFLGKTRRLRLRWCGCQLFRRQFKRGITWEAAERRQRCRRELRSCAEGLFCPRIRRRGHLRSRRWWWFHQGQRWLR